MKRTAYFAATVHGKHRLVLVTEDEPGFKVIRRGAAFDSWETARDVAMARNKYEKRLTFAARDAILASVLLARTQAALVAEGKGWMCPGKPAHYSPSFRNTCEVCGAAPFPRKKSGAPRG